MMWSLGGDTTVLDDYTLATTMTTSVQIRQTEYALVKIATIQ